MLLVEAAVSGGSGSSNGGDDDLDEQGPGPNPFGTECEQFRE